MWLGVNLKMNTKRSCEEDIGLCAQNWLIIVGPRVNIIGWAYMIIEEERILTLTMNLLVLQK